MGIAGYKNPLYNAMKGVGYVKLEIAGFEVEGTPEELAIWAARFTEFMTEYAKKNNPQPEKNSAEVSGLFGNMTIEDLRKQ